MLKNAYLDAKIGFDPAENEPSKVSAPNLSVLRQYTESRSLGGRQRGPAQAYRTTHRQHLREALRSWAWEAHGIGGLTLTSFRMDLAKKPPAPGGIRDARFGGAGVPGFGSSMQRRQRSLRHLREQEVY